MQNFLKSFSQRMAMTKISGIAYLLIGVAVIAISLFSNYRTKTNSMLIFIVIGAVFCIIGIAKIALKTVKAKNKGKIHQKNTNPSHNVQQSLQAGQGIHSHQQVNPYSTHHQPQSQHQHSGNNSQHHYPQHSQSHTMFPQHTVCRQCGARNNLGSNFCMRCGSRIR